MKLYIKYMVSIRCKMVVKAALDELGLHYGAVDLGAVDVLRDISLTQRVRLKTMLVKAGLELMDDRKAILIEKIKGVIIEMIHYSDELPSVKKSIYISGKMGYDYTYLSNLFAEVTGTTIEQYIIAHKIERIKELLIYDELSVKEIAYKLDYSSVAHMSNQFKKVTGLTPGFFKKLKNKKRMALEEV